MTEERRLYAIPAWREERPDTFWKDYERRKWEEFFKKTVICILTELKLEEDETASAFSQNLWYYGNADEEEIRQQLKMYKLYIA